MLDMIDSLDYPLPLAGINDTVFQAFTLGKRFEIYGCIVTEFRLGVDPNEDSHLINHSGRVF